jgi:hypothetical protein
MRILSVILMLLFSLSLFATTEIKTQIYDIDMGQQNEVPLVFLTSGQVVSFPEGKKADLDRLKEALLKKTWMLITINDKREILQLKEVATPPTYVTKTLKFTEDAPVFVPSILKDMDEARTLFYESRSEAKEESQCFNRAHVWTYEWRTKRNVYSSKVWLFFTRKYIRKNKFEWWFHVAPMVHVVHQGEVKERVMDIKYSRANGPVKLKQWTNIFMRDSAECPVVQKYTDHADYPESGSCFVMKSSMYYYQPVDLEQKDLSGFSKWRWLEPEVKHAYLDAFDITL